MAKKFLYVGKPVIVGNQAGIIDAIDDDGIRVSFNQTDFGWFDESEVI